MPYKVNTLKLKNAGYPTILANIPDPPKQIFFTGAALDAWLDKPKVAIVGSRKVSDYGSTVTRRLASELANFGVVVISGLALGVDALAHTGALEGGGVTVAVLPTNLSRVYPASHTGLARRILANGGTLVSEYSVGTPSLKYNFIARNRIVSGLADVLVITEAAANSGTLHTASFALEQGKTVMAVPGNITSPTSAGSNHLIKAGAAPVTSVEDVLLALNIQPDKKALRPFKGTDYEEALLKDIRQGVADQEELALKNRLDAQTLNQALTTLEISGYIKPAGAGRWLGL